MVRTPIVARPHDLLELRAPVVIPDNTSECVMPNWAALALAEAPFVVVRRAPQVGRLIPAGIRGTERHQRWPCFVDFENIERLIPPMDLLALRGRINRERQNTVPALQRFQALASQWERIPYPWGPFGSVGFELASGLPVTCLTSDLDIVLYVGKPFSQDVGRVLLGSIEGIGGCVDVHVETPQCAFSLAEYSTRDGTRILLRGLHGCRLGFHPWTEKTGNSLRGLPRTTC
jgi:phosphoribosyl-dephospho-CoA transferase